MQVAVTIPVFNEKAQLAESIQALRAVARGWEAFNCFFIIADNGSTDGTTEIARNLAATYPDVRCEFLREKGRGRALRRAWLNAEADVVSYMDVDLSTDVAHFPELVMPLIEGKADIAVGSRLLRPEWTSRGWRREALSRGYNTLLKAAFSHGFSDAQCGFKAITKKCADHVVPLVKDEAWFFDTELLIIAEALGYRIFDLPVRWTDDPDSRVRIIQTVIEDLKGVVRLRRTRHSLVANHHEKRQFDSRLREVTAHIDRDGFRQQPGLLTSENQHKQ